MPVGLEKRVWMESLERKQVEEDSSASVMLYAFFFFLAIPPGIQDLSSPPRDGTQAPLQWKCGVLTTGMLQNSPCSPLLLKILPKPHLSHYHLPARPTGSK